MTDDPKHPVADPDLDDLYAQDMRDDLDDTARTCHYRAPDVKTDGPAPGSPGRRSAPAANEGTSHPAGVAFREDRGTGQLEILARVDGLLWALIQDLLDEGRVDWAAEANSLRGRLTQLHRKIRD